MCSLTPFCIATLCSFQGWIELKTAFIFSMSEIQNARGIMDVLAEMLNALDPGNREVPKFHLSLIQSAQKYGPLIFIKLQPTVEPGILIC